MEFDVIVIGAGAAGMMCAAEAAGRGRRVLLIEHAGRIGERIRISGGGRCNFTNRDAGAANYLSRNAHFCRSALARFTPRQFIERVERRGIRWEERRHGQLFCTETAQDIIDMLVEDCATAGVHWAHPCAVRAVSRHESSPGRFVLDTDRGEMRCDALVVATGGLAVPKLGATPFGLRLAAQFGIPVVPPMPALVPLALPPDTLAHLAPLSGLSVDAVASAPGASFHESVLVTHRGVSGPAILQTSSYWQAQDYEDGKAANAPEAPARREPVSIDLLPGTDAASWLQSHRSSRMLLANLLAEKLPRRFAQEWCALHGWTRPLAEMGARDLAAAAAALKRWELHPSGTLGYAKAEVMLGGVDTRALSSKTMEATAVPGLYFIGEVVDVTGWLGGYNFQWAWSSGWVAGQHA